MTFFGTIFSSKVCWDGKRTFDLQALMSDVTLLAEVARLLHNDTDSCAGERRGRKRHELFGH